MSALESVSPLLEQNSKNQCGAAGSYLEKGYYHVLGLLGSQKNGAQWAVGFIKELERNTYVPSGLDLRNK